ncbi:hypothetical protein RHMOL_Rhmol04G0260100 [Rhododendron molle]|uniref:Uncharacterized protein n=1 Tax=Rhododendron molle TaxID=49168 RepID=A0ACC0P6P3_RHOML|nr:hypothetical protein RHMOL_Rhmol04G0260100 [Rhododendron molle]
MFGDWVRYWNFFLKIFGNRVEGDDRHIPAPNLFPICSLVPTSPCPRNICTLVSITYICLGFLLINTHISYFSSAAHNFCALLLYVVWLPVYIVSKFVLI